MKTNMMIPVVVVAATFLFVSCGQAEQHNEQASTENAMPSVTPVSMKDLNEPVDFPGAQIGLGNVTATPNGDSVKLSFSFTVKNYELKNQTSDANSQVCSNSDKGQHLHFILDNKPYVALYEPKHETTVLKNSEHYLLAFLSRSYHLSLKNKEAALVFHFKVDENGKLQKLDDPKTPMLFYSRPKGDYFGKDTENVLFDFYVWNATLGADYQVKTNINSGGKDTSFMITEWKPHFLKNLAMGKTKITLSLIDKNGNKVEGPETEVSREIQLSKEEPIQ